MDVVEGSSVGGGEQGFRSANGRAQWTEFHGMHTPTKRYSGPALLIGTRATYNFMRPFGREQKKPNNISNL